MLLGGCSWSSRSLVWTKKGWINNQNGSKNYPKEHDQFCGPSFSRDISFNFCTTTYYSIVDLENKNALQELISIQCDNLTFLRFKIFVTDTLIHSAHYFVLTINNGNQSQKLNFGAKFRPKYLSDINCLKNILKKQLVWKIY